ncbi:hypothetical protein T440DRAFT_470484 [Plenodomus tracheiphilus IPT5]|uniref:Uncharacterized protein n=1 Tax=Plenodomus tracheiphilus IPT5 TaxID=1408161 RepID=A0A6A7AXY7_9PLEO|nr:hypothetical protein T440DRAFT_470484 [Plenodomus tracheiphilus IPT5]
MIFLRISLAASFVLSASASSPGLARGLVNVNDGQAQHKPFSVRHSLPGFAEHEVTVSDLHTQNANISTKPLRFAGLAVDDVSTGYNQDLVHSRPIRAHAYIKCDGQGEIDSECRQWCSCSKTDEMRCQDPADIDVCSVLCRC